MSSELRYFISVYLLSARPLAGSTRVKYSRLQANNVLKLIDALLPEIDREIWLLQRDTNHHLKEDEFMSAGPKPRKTSQRLGMPEISDLSSPNYLGHSGAVNLIIKQVIVTGLKFEMTGLLRKPLKLALIQLATGITPKLCDLLVLHLTNPHYSTLRSR